MLHRAFGTAFSEDEIEDLYGNAWLGTLRALRNRQGELSDEELRRYVLTAVANQASRELRRRGRRPTAPLEAAGSVADRSALPDERAAGREESRIARDVLGSLPGRRRAVLVFRYGWGLNPQEVCGLVKGLSQRAYRKEITRGVDEVGRKLRMVEAGEWCADRQPLLNAVVAGTADAEQRRQAEHHLAHCRHCAEYVGKLSGQLHDLGSSIAWVGVLDAVDDGRLGLSDRAGMLLERGKDAVASALGRAPNGSEEAAAQLTGSGAVRGAGTAGAGVFAKLGLGAVTKTVAACLGTGAAATACAAAGVLPGLDLAGGDLGRPAEERTAAGSEPQADYAPAYALSALREAVATEPAPEPSSADPASTPSETAAEPTSEPAVAPAPEPAPEAATSTPPSSSPLAEPDPVVEEFEPVGTPVQPSGPSSPPSATSSSSDGDGRSPSSGSSGDFGP